MFYKYKKLFLYISTALILFIFISSLYIFIPKLPNSIDNRLRDHFFSIRGEIEPKTDSLTIIDIDEKSIKKLGQWPWPRDILSQILINLKNANVAIIGMDIVFAEADRSSPHNIFNKLNIKKENIPNFDLEFAQTIASTPTILGYQFEFQDKEYISKEAPSIQTIFIEKNKIQGENYLIEAQGSILNLPVLQDSSYSSGFFNNIPDDSGIIRSVPLIISYDDEIYPSLALESLRIALGTKKIYINYNENGVKNLQVSEYIIPTDRHGRLLINFRGKEKTFKYISALDIYNNEFKKEEIENKITLIGTSAAALMDLRATPYESVFPGVEVHANLIDNILAQDFLYKPSWVDGLNIIIIFTLILISMLFIKKVPFWATPFSISFLLLSTVYILYYLLFNVGLVINIFFPLLTIILTTLVTLVIEYFFEIRKKEAIKNKFASKVSKNVMEQLISNVNNNQLDSRNKEITIFFSDIRSFTELSEKIKDPKELILFINSYMTPMSEIIINHEGTIDKYIGDSIMAYWNAPFDIDSHPDKAVTSAIEQLKKLKSLNNYYIENNKPKIEIGIGITTGNATVGELGSIGRSDYTVIGDTINIASRVESLCKFYGVNLIITNETKERLTGTYNFRYLDLVRVKGKNEAVELWEIYLENTKQIEDELTMFNQAIKLYKAQNIRESLNILNSLIEKNPHRKIYTIYKNRCLKYLEDKTFSLIYNHESKS